MIALMNKPAEESGEYLSMWNGILYVGKPMRELYSACGAI